LNPDITRDARGGWLEARGPAIWSLTYEELQQYDVGRIRPDSEYGLRFPRQTAVDATRIPRLADVFDLVNRSGQDGVRFNMETKISPIAPDDTAPPELFVETLLDTIAAAAMQSRVDIQSFDWRTLALVQNAAPRIPTVYLTAEQNWMDNICRAASASAWTAPRHVSTYGGSHSRMIADAGGAVWSPYFGEATAQHIGEAHALGLRVVVWTVNEETAMRRLIELGADGIISDYPDTLRRVAGLS
jgi:glycerophosphoryl diester phosphodiesterase